MLASRRRHSLQRTPQKSEERLVRTRKVREVLSLELEEVWIVG
jgi:hypothetical protein